MSMSGLVHGFCGDIGVPTIFSPHQCHMSRDSKPWIISTKMSFPRQDDQKLITYNEKTMTVKVSDLLKMACNANCLKPT